MNHVERSFLDLEQLLEALYSKLIRIVNVILNTKIELHWRHVQPMASKHEIVRVLDWLGLSHVKVAVVIERVDK